MPLNSEPPRALSNQGVTSGLDSRPGQTAERPRVSREGQGSPRKPNQTRPVLLPLSTSQNQLQIQQPALQSLPNSSDSFPAAALSPDAPMPAASIPAADLSDAASGSASWLTKAGSRSGSAQQQSVIAIVSDDKDSAGVSEDSSASESYSDSESEASSSGALTSRQLQVDRSKPGENAEQRLRQSAALQQSSRDVKVSTNSSQSTRSTQSLQESAASQNQRAPGNGLESLQSNPAVIELMLNKQAKKKWRMFQ
ncbi:TPA: hypothetical protein ACH3X2_009278 [Trebouxia sp. C0005]